MGKMHRKIVAAAVAAIVGSSMMVSSAAAHHPRPRIQNPGTPLPQPCYFYQYKALETRPKFFHCTNGEVRQLGVNMILASLMNQIGVTTTQIRGAEDWGGDTSELQAHLNQLWSSYWDWREVGSRLAEANPDSDVVLGWNEVDHYRVVDMLEVGTNVTFYTHPLAGDSYRLFIEDKLGREIKVAGKFVTNNVKCVGNELLKITGGVMTGMWFSGAGAIATTKVAPILTAQGLESLVRWGPTIGGGLEIGVDQATKVFEDATPKCGETEVLYDLLNIVHGNDGEELAQVYRVNLHITADGNIRAVKDNKVLEGERVNGWWFLGWAEKDANGKWVW
jgi:hypothetical protein